MKTLIFDFDGTLADTLAINHQILNRLAKVFRFRQTDTDELKRLKGLPIRQIMQAMEITPFKAPFVMAAGKYQLGKYIDDIQMPKGLVECLQQWQQDYRLGVVSTNSTSNIERFLLKTNAPRFDFIYANARLHGKAKSIERAMKAQGLEKADCIYIGDEIRDIDAARDVGIKCISVTWGYNNKTALENAKPDWMADNVGQLAKCIDNLGKRN